MQHDNDDTRAISFYDKLARLAQGNKCSRSCLAAEALAVHSTHKV